MHPQHDFQQNFQYIDYLTKALIRMTQSENRAFTPMLQRYMPKLVVYLIIAYLILKWDRLGKVLGESRRWQTTSKEGEAE